MEGICVEYAYSSSTRMTQTRAEIVKESWGARGQESGEVVESKVKCCVAAACLAFRLLLDHSYYIILWFSIPYHTIPYHRTFTITRP